MSTFPGILAVDAERVFNFFLSNIQEEVSERSFKQDEMLYVSSVLAHYAQTSCVTTTDIPSPASLSDVFDRFVLGQSEIFGSELFEIGGAQSLFLAGFFRDQMERRHNVLWYDRLGQSFYYRAADLSRDKKRRQLFWRMMESFPQWTLICRNVHRNLRESQYLFRPQL